MSEWIVSEPKWINGSLERRVRVDRFNLINVVLGFIPTDFPSSLPLSVNTSRPQDSFKSQILTWNRRPYIHDIIPSIHFTDFTDSPSRFRFRDVNYSECWVTTCICSTSHHSSNGSCVMCHTPDQRSGERYRVASNTFSTRRRGSCLSFEFGEKSGFDFEAIWIL